MDIPVLRLHKVFHVGSMDSSRRGENSGRSSQEGACLSVSLTPNAWASIARLGNELHILENPDGVFLDVVALLSDEEARSEVLSWAVEAGLTETRALWRVWNYDDETEEWRFLLFTTSTEAFSEACCQADQDYAEATAVPGPDGHSGIEQIEAPVGLEPLQKLTGFSVRPDEDATNAIVTAFAMLRGEQLTGRPFDGVWWRETYAPDSLSSPRGGIFQTRVELWAKSRGSLNDVDDDSELDAMPDTEMLSHPPIWHPQI